MPFMKVLEGKNKGKVVLFDTVSTEGVVTDIDGNSYFRENIRELTAEEEQKYLKVEEIDLGL